MTDIKLLPLPQAVRMNSVHGDPLEMYSGLAMKSYARAVAEHNVKALRAEVEHMTAGMNAALAKVIEFRNAQHEAALDKVIEFGNARHEAEARADQLQAELDNRWATGVHTCHDKCQRIACVLRRENEALRAGKNRWIRAANTAIRSRDAHHSRAERLAEALQEISELDEREGDSISTARSIARDALRDHDKEGGNP